MKNIFIFLLLISLFHASSVEFDFKDQYAVRNAQNNFTINFKCNEESEYLVYGEIVKYRITFHLDNISLESQYFIEGLFPFEPNCNYYKKATIFMPQGIENITVIAKARNELLNIWKDTKNKSYTYQRDEKLKMPVYTSENPFKFKLFSIFTLGLIIIILGIPTFLLRSVIPGIIAPILILLGIFISFMAFVLNL